MELTRVRFDGSDDTVIALYIDDKLEKYGDHYHNKIEHFLDGVEYGLQLAHADFCIADWIGYEEGLKPDHPLVVSVTNGNSPPNTLQEILDSIK